MSRPGRTSFFRLVFILALCLGLLPQLAAARVGPTGFERHFGTAYATQRLGIVPPGATRVILAAGRKLGGTRPPSAPKPKLGPKSPGKVKATGPRKPAVKPPGKSTVTPGKKPQAKSIPVTVKKPNPKVAKPKLPKGKGHPIPRDLPRAIHPGQQGKHVPGHNNYKPALRKSVLKSNRTPQQLLDGVHSGQYKIVGWRKRGTQNLPIVNFKTPVGHEHSNPTNATRFGKIHYGKGGAHIVPFFGTP